MLFISCQSQENGQVLIKSERLELFERVWSIVNEQFYDPNFNGINWNEKQTEYKPLVESCNNSDSLFYFLNNMLFEINSSHCGIGLISELKKDVSPYLFMDGEIGIDIRILDNQIVVTKVFPNSPAGLSQIKTGYIIERIDSLSLADFKKTVRYKPPRNKRNKIFHLTTEVLRHLYGQAGTSVKIDYLDEKDISRSIVFSRSKRENGISLVEGMPDVFVQSESYYLSEKVAYLTFNAFQPADLEHVLKELKKVSKAPGLIIDFRGNDGGSITAMKLFLGRFVSERKKYGTYINRYEENEDFIEPLGNKFNGKIVALVDEMSISGAENAPVIMQQLNIATVIGNRTPGQLLWGNGYVIGDTVFLVIPIYKFEYLNGFNPENNGITPDIVTELNRRDLLNGKDTQLERAIEYLMNE